ncbi:MAG: hypothetical protein Q7S22_05000 [Candidatus Micrarchaeota archaeon]|nr:hypothetical protein [Candidatus Micrarchaeota archaeon]
MANLAIRHKKTRIKLPDSRMPKHTDPLQEALTNSNHVSRNTIENRKFHRALAKIDETVRQIENREAWIEIIETAKKSDKPGSYLIMILNVSGCNYKRAEEFLKVLEQIAKRIKLNSALPFDKNSDRKEKEDTTTVRDTINELLNMRTPQDADNILQNLSLRAKNMLQDNGLTVIRKRTNRRIITACVNLEMQIPLETGGNVYITYNMPETLSELAGWVSKNRRDVYVVDRALGEGNGESKLSMRSRVSSTLQHELQHLFNAFFGFSRVNDEYCAYLAGFSFGRIRSKHMTMLKKPEKRSNDAAKQAMSRISEELRQINVDIKLRNRGHIAEVCKELLEKFYLEKTGLCYGELIAPFVAQL